MAHATPEHDGEIIDQAVAVKEATGKDVTLDACDHAQLYPGGTRRALRH